MGWAAIPGEGAELSCGSVEMGWRKEDPAVGAATPEPAGCRGSASRGSSYSRSCVGV